MGRRTIILLVSSVLLLLFSQCTDTPKKTQSSKGISRKPGDLGEGIPGFIRKIQNLLLTSVDSANGNYSLIGSITLQDGSSVTFSQLIALAFDNEQKLVGRADIQSNESFRLSIVTNKQEAFIGIFLKSDLQALLGGAPVDLSTLTRLVLSGKYSLKVNLKGIDDPGPLFPCSVPGVGSFDETTTFLFPTAIENFTIQEGDREGSPGSFHMTSCEENTPGFDRQVGVQCPTLTHVFTGPINTNREITLTFGESALLTLIKAIPETVIISGGENGNTTCEAFICNRVFATSTSVTFSLQGSNQSSTTKFLAENAVVNGPNGIEVTEHTIVYAMNPSVTKLESATFQVKDNNRASFNVFPDFGSGLDSGYKVLTVPFGLPKNLPNPFQVPHFISTSNTNFSSWEGNVCEQRQRYCSFCVTETDLSKIPKSIDLIMRSKPGL